MFSSGNPNACLSVAEIFKEDNEYHELIFLHQQQDRIWWDDVQSLKGNIPRCVLMADFLKESEPLDLLIEIAFFVSPLMRPRVARKCIWYNRKPGLFTDLESSVYGSRTGGRDLEGITGILTADCFTTKEDIVYLQTLYPKIPIEVVPWIWTPAIVEYHRTELKSPVWLSNYEVATDAVPWSFHISETNNTNISSCILPLTIIKHAINSKPFSLANVNIHNTDILKKNAFFKENVLAHTVMKDIPYNLVGRQRCIDWVYDPKSVIVSHNRFISIKASNLESIWVGIPVVHNNEHLRDLGHGLNELYYKSNSITGAARAIHKLTFETSTIPYISSLESLTSLRKVIMSRFYPRVHSNAWNIAISRICSVTNITSTMPQATMPQATMPQATMSQATMPQATMPPGTLSTIKAFTILFTDMWDSFNESHNMFTLALESALPSTEIKGYSINTIPVNESPDIVIFGPFGTLYNQLPEDWPKVHFTGENSQPIQGKSIKLNIGFNHTLDKSYLRMPLWMFEIDWFGADLEKIQNPIPLPIDTCTQVDPESYSRRSKFCAFVVSNPSNPVRNSAFFALNSYKPVDSAGQLYNNVGNEIFAGLGGGGGELKKHLFLKNYRFCIAYENSSASGYTTEKLLHAKAAGCVPIYWGDPSVAYDFDERGFINANGFKNELDLINAVNTLESNEDIWKQYASVPALTTEKREIVRKIFSEMVKKFLEIAGKKAHVPELLGATTSAEADFMRKSRINSVQVGLPSDPFLVTGATQRFWPNVIMWLDSLQKHRSSVPGLTARVYVGADLSEAALKRTSDVYRDFVEFIRYPSETPVGFPDFWEPQHYAWKLWIYNTLVNDMSIKGRLVFYMDSASILVRWPLEWINQARTSGLSFLNDTTQINKHWCHSKFCEALKVTEQELKENQIAACLLLFVAGHPKAVELFSTAYLLGKIRDVISGEKWEGLDTSGKPYGHRHDQSILSILSQRMNIDRVPIDTVYCDKSARATFHSGKSVYVHRGNYKTHTPYLPGIDEIFAINLDRREDRKKSFIEHHPELKGTLRRQPAYDGRAMKLGPYLARMFKPNDFHWKKAVMGCALSHLKLLNMLVNEPPDINAYCILEDDCRLEKGWQSKWARIYPNLPDDWDCIYLGGVLPPNKPGFTSVLERVAPGLSRIAPNQIFGQRKPTRYFHFCTYAYVISKAGAKKILQSILESDGYSTSADHMMCNPVDRMNNYVVDPLLAGASQDDDPIYQTADFNNFNRVDNFDSDLWNNDDRFSADEVINQQSKGAPLDIYRTLREADGEDVSILIQATKTVLNKPPRFISLDICNIVSNGLYELEWLEELLGLNISIEPVSINETLDDSKSLIVVLRKPLWSEQIQWLDSLARKGHTFKIIHLSDEFISDPVDFYSWPSVTGVLRNYYRDDLQDDPKVIVIPLGYHWSASSVKDFQTRKYTWSFVGTNWANRQVDMMPLNNIQENNTVFYENWRDPGNLSETDYMALLADTKFVPCPRGNNVETYRFYEALESGCIPVFIDYPDTANWMRQFNMGNKSMNFFRIPNWSTAAEVINGFKDDTKMMLEYQRMILKGWEVFKDTLKKRVRNLMI